MKCYAEHPTEDDVNWIDPNDKTQAKYLPWIGEKCLISHAGEVYAGTHTGGSFKTGQGATAKTFDTWKCKWAPWPKAA